MAGSGSQRQRKMTAPAPGPGDAALVAAGGPSFAELWADAVPRACEAEGPRAGRWQPVAIGPHWHKDTI
jgi:hypothetical protein